MKTKISRISKRSISLLLSILMVVSMMIVGMVSTNAAYTDSHFYLIGDIVGSWSTSSYKISNSYNSQAGKFYIEVNVSSTPVYFALKNDGGSQYGPSSNGTELTGTGVIGDYNSNAWKYSGSASKVKICIDQRNNDSDNQYRPYVWLEEVAVTTTYTVSATAQYRESSGSSYSTLSGVTPTVSPSSVTSGSSATITAPTVSGYTFETWAIKSGTGTFGSASSKSTTFKPTSNSVLYARYIKDSSSSGGEGGDTTDPLSDYYIHYGSSKGSTGTHLQMYKASDGTYYATMDRSSGNFWFIINKSSSSTSTSLLKSNTNIEYDSQYFASWSKMEDQGGVFHVGTSVNNSTKVKVIYDPTSNKIILTTASSTPSEPGYFVAGRFQVKDSNGTHHQIDWNKTNTDENFKFVETGTENVYSLATNYTIAELSKDLQCSGYKAKQYFMIYDSSTGQQYNASVDMEDCVEASPAQLTTIVGNEAMRFRDENSSEEGTVTLYFNSQTKQLWYNLSGQADPLAESVTLSASKSSITAGEPFTLTATLNNKASGATNLTYTFYQNGSLLAENTTGTLNISNTDSMTGTYSYYVVVSTTDSYEADGETLTYRSVRSSATSVTVAGKGLFYSSDLSSGKYTDVTWSDDISEKDKVTINTTLTGGKSYTFAFSDMNTGFNDHYSVQFAFDKAKSKYVTFSTGSILDGVRTYTVTCNPGCKNPVITIDVQNKTIYAVASYTPTIGKTESSSKKVTYYFGEMTDNENWCYTGAGVKINYWNNSTGKSGSYVATQAVKVNNSNTIYVDTDEWYQGPNAGVKTFKVYKAELPVWATTFAFVDADGSQMSSSTNSTSYTNYGTLALNPNRIYLFYAKDSARYTKGVVLDQDLWVEDTNSSTKSNDPSTKNFKANLVNYNDNRGTLNSALSSAYGSSYKHALYFGDFNPGSGKEQSRSGLNNFKFWNNLAQRADDKSYHASVWDLTGSMLSYSNARSISTFGTLMGYDDTTVHPLFDYDGALKNSNIASAVYTDLNFPFYESEYNGVTTYSYDSITDHNRRYDSDAKDFKLSSQYAYGLDATGDAQFTGYFPFGNNTGRDTNCGYGTEFQIEFYMTESGKLYCDDGTYQDIAFNFSGDDDVWVYVDGVRVLDLGGTHKISAGSINFSDMTVYYKSAAKGTDALDDSYGSTDYNSTKDSFSTNTANVNTISLAEVLGAHGVNFSNTDSTTKHTLQMFYMERGIYQSNCSISFNLPQNAGLRVASNVDTSKVQSAFVNDTLFTANNDFFAYFIENKLATSTELSKINTKFRNGSFNLTAAQKLEILNLNSESPLYPLGYAVERVFGTARYQFAIDTNSTGEKSADYIGSNTTPTSSFIDVAGVNYKLSDSNFVAASDLGAAYGVSGRTGDTGNFNLLFQQSANFVSKITPNTLVAVTQKNSINTVTHSNGVVTPGTGTRLVSDYYTTTYTLTDDRNSTVIVNSTTPQKASGENGSILLDDASGNNNSFFFANYKTDSESSDISVAMTATFNNAVEVGAIKIEKALYGATVANNDYFFFNVKFSNMFGGSSNAREYSALEYDVYNSDGTKVNNQPIIYGTTGIKLLAGQYALIKGVPVGTKYTITERSRVGYALDSVEASCAYVGTVSGTPTEPKVTDGVVSGTIPTISTITSEATAAGYTSLSSAKFINKKQAITVTFKYYDRLVENGTVAHINTRETEYHKTYEEFPVGTVEMSDIGEVSKLYLDLLITDAYVKFATDTNVTNVIDDYKMWNKQSVAEGYMANEYYIIGKKNYSSANGGGAYRTDCYGNPVNDDYWVSYYDQSGRRIDDAEDNEGTHADVKSIVVWLFNQPKKYTISMYTADNFTIDLKAVGDRYVTNTTTADKFEATAYYNLRLGGNEAYTDADGNVHFSEMNDPGEYLMAYGIEDGFISAAPKTEASFDTNGDGIDDIVFVGWASDPEGKYIVSSEINYYYRITTDITLYAVYKTPSETNEPGLTVFKNQEDYFFDSNGKTKTRLNTQMNPYNCPMNDKNIENVAIVYVMMTGNALDLDLDTLTDEQLEEMRNDIASVLANTSSSNVSGKVTVVGVDKNANGFVYNVVDSADEIEASNDVILTNKNRIQFSTTFSTSVISGRRMLAFAGMYYTGKGWIVSDNYVEYNFSNAT